MAPLTNITVTVPTGSAQYGDQLCLPASWTDILTFYLSNYVVHVGSVQFYPGEIAIDTSIALLAALLFPTAGVVRGFDRIARFAILGKDALSQAARAGALCMVVRCDGWKPTPGDTFENVVYQHRSRDETGQDSNDDGSKMPVKPPESGNALDLGAAAKPDDTEPHANTRTAQDWRTGQDLHAPSPSTDPLLPRVAISYLDEDSSFDRPATLRIYQALWVQDGSAWWNYTGSEEMVDYSQQRKVSGSVQLPAGYRLAIVPRDATVESLGKSDRAFEPRALQKPTTFVVSDGLHTNVTNILRNLIPTLKPQPAISRGKVKGDDNMVTCSYSAVSALSGVAQLLFSLSTIYTAAGPQVDRFGYAAFGLTVLQYTVMSLVNTIATLVTPAYPCLYMVDSEIMQEAKTRGGEFVGVVGRLKPDESPAVFSEWNSDDIIKNGTAICNAADPCLQSSTTSKCGKTTIAQPPTSSAEALRESLVFRAYSAEPTEVKRRSVTATPVEGSAATSVQPISPILMRLLKRLNSRADERVQRCDQETATATPDSILYIPCHPQFARKKRWYCGPDGYSVLPWYKLGRTASPFAVLCYILLGLVPLLPIGLLSHFRRAHSTYAERVVIMLWFAMGIFLGAIIGIAKKDIGVVDKVVPSGLITRLVQKNNEWWNRDSSLVAGFCFFYGAPAITGFVEVGIMYSKFGTCMQLYTNDQS